MAKTDKAKNPLGQNAKVRQALELAIDREAINQVVFNGEFVPGNQWVGPDNFYYQKSVPVSKRDVAKAKALIKEAGVTTPIVIDFMVPQGAENKAISEVIQAMAAEAGFDMKIRVTEFATSLKMGETGEYQAYLIGWSGRTDPDGNLYSFHACNAPNNNGGYCNAEVDKLLERGAHLFGAGQAQGGVREGGEVPAHRGPGPHHLSLSPQGADRADHEARGFRAGAGRAGARGGAEAQVILRRHPSPRSGEGGRLRSNRPGGAFPLGTPPGFALRAKPSSPFGGGMFPRGEG